MKRPVVILSTLLLSLAVVAQDFDRMLFADQDIHGTARYVSMGGAFAALGGDVSAVVDNPAALGVFRRSEFSFTVDGTVGDHAREGNRMYVPNALGLPQISGVISWGKPYKHTGVIYNNLILQYHQLQDYSRRTLVAGQASSQTHWMATAANEQGVDVRDVLQEGVWSKEDISWLSLMGIQSGLIDYDRTSNQWQSITDALVDASLNVREAGSLDQYTLGWGCNISNNVYLGLTANLRTLSYEKISYYDETFADGRYSLNSTFVGHGMGFNGSAGVIYRPTGWLRLGASFQSPTWMTIRMRNYADMSYTGVGQAVDIESPENSTNTYGYTYMLPMRAVGGLAFQINTIGVVSLEYDYTHQFDQSIPDVHWVRLGTEWVVKKNLFLRLGGAYKSSFQKEDMMLRWSYDAVRTDTDFRSVHGTAYVSAGIGYRNRRWIIDVAYQYRLASMNQYMIEDGAPFELTNQTHRLVLSLGWNRR